MAFLDYCDALSNFLQKIQISEIWNIYGRASSLFGGGASTNFKNYNIFETSCIANLCKFYPTSHHLLSTKLTPRVCTVQMMCRLKREQNMFPLLLAHFIYFITKLNQSASTVYIFFEYSQVMFNKPAPCLATQTGLIGPSALIRYM